MLNKIHFTAKHTTPRFTTVLARIPKHMLPEGTNVDWLVLTRQGNEPLLASLERHRLEATESVARIRAMGWADFEAVDIQLASVAIAALGGAV